MNRTVLKGFLERGFTRNTFSQGREDLEDVVWPFQSERLGCSRGHGTESRTGPTSAMKEHALMINTNTAASRIMSLFMAVSIRGGSDSRSARIAISAALLAGGRLQP